MEKPVIKRSTFARCITELMHTRDGTSLCTEFPLLSSRAVTSNAQGYSRPTRRSSPTARQDQYIE